MKRYRLLVICFVFFLTGTALTQESRLDEGEKYLKERDYEKAISIFKEILDRMEWNELSAKSALRLGQCYCALKDYQKARHFFRKAALWKGDIGGEAQIGIAESYIREKKYDRAINILSQVISQYKTDRILAYAYYNRGLAYKEKKWIGKALNDFARAKGKAKDEEALAKASEKESRECRSLYEEFKNKESDYLGKIQSAQQMGDLDSCASLLRELARLCEDWGEMEEAIDYEMQAIDYSSSEEFKAGSWMNIGYRYYKQGNYKKAEEAFKEVVEKYPKSSYAPQALLILGDMQSAPGQAEKLYKRVVGEYANSEYPPRAMMNLYWLYKREGEGVKAKETLKELSESFPNTEFGWFARGLYHEEEGETEKAIEAYKKVVEFNGSQRPLALLSLGGRYTDLGEYNSAIKIFEELIKEYKDKGIQRDIVAEAMWYMGRCYEHLLDFPRAMKAYSQLCSELSPEELETSMGKGWYQDAEFSIGYCYLQLEEYEKAFNIWEQLLEEANGELQHIIRRLLSSYKNVIVPTNQQINKQQMEGKTKLLGPIYGIFMDFKMEFRRKDKILIVYGTQSEDEEENKACEDLAFKLKKHLGEALPCKKDTDVSPEEIQNKNLVLIGTPYSNKVLTIFSDTLPIKTERETIKVANRTYEGKDIGVIMVVPHPLNKDSFLLIYSAFEPSLLRNILSIYHGNTDYIVFSKQSLSDINEPDPTKPSLEEGYFLKRPNKWEASFSKKQYYKEVR